MNTLYTNQVFLLSKSSPSRDRGAFLVILAVGILALLAIFGLAVDMANVQRARLRLQRALDSSSVAATFLLELQSSTQIINTARQIVLDNLSRSGFSNSQIIGTPGVTLLPNSSAPRKVLVNAQVRPPLFILNKVPWINQTVNISASAEAMNRRVTVALVLDTSGSMTDSAPCDSGTCNKLQAMKDAAISFINQFGAQDRLALISFGSTATVRYNMTANPNKTTLTNIINGLNANGWTNTGAAIEAAKQQLRSSVNNNMISSDYAAIVIVTDGAPQMDDVNPGGGGWSADPTPTGFPQNCYNLLGATDVVKRTKSRYIDAIMEGDQARNSQVGNNNSTGLYPRIFTLGIGLAGIPTAGAVCNLAPSPTPTPCPNFPGINHPCLRYNPSDPFQCQLKNDFIKEYVLARMSNDQELMDGDPAATPTVSPYPDFPWPADCVPSRAMLTGQPTGQFFPIYNTDLIDDVLLSIGLGIRGRLNQ